MKKTLNFQFSILQSRTVASYDNTVQDIVLIHIPTRKALRKKQAPKCLLGVRRGGSSIVSTPHINHGLSPSSLICSWQILLL